MANYSQAAEARGAPGDRVRGGVWAQDVERREVGK
jgi:hypothetical protein